MIDASPRHRDENDIYLRERSVKIHKNMLSSIKNRKNRYLTYQDELPQLSKSPSAKLKPEYQIYHEHEENKGLVKRINIINQRNNKFICDQREVNSLLLRRKHQYELLRTMERKRLLMENDAYLNRIQNTVGVVNTQSQEESKDEKKDKKKATRKIKLKKIKRNDIQTSKSECFITNKEETKREEETKEPGEETKEAVNEEL